MRQGMIRGLLCGALLWCALAQAAPTWYSTMDEAQGLPAVEVGGVRAVNASWVFWAENWKWAGLQPAVQTAVAPASGWTVTGNSGGLGLDVQARFQSGTAQRWTADVTLKAAAARSGVIGGGFSFRFDLPSWRAEMGDPVLLPGNQGWRWGRDGGRQIEMRVDPPLASVYFEKGSPAEVRAYFYKDEVPAGERRFRITWTERGGIQPRAPLTERLGGPPSDKWPTDPTSVRQSPVDLSFLNRADRPAGKRGPVRAQGDSLVFADGTPARFWGTNVTAYALFTTPRETVREQARRLAALGYNLVRLHHHDSPWVPQNIFGNFKSLDGTQTLDPAALESLDWWIKCLKDEGIYVWLDLHAQRAFKAGDGITGFDEVRRGKDTADLKGFSYVNPSMQAAMKRFNEAFLSHRNAFTGVANKDEPAVLALLLTNENDVTNHFGNAMLPDKNVPQHNRLYQAKVDEFARRTGLPAEKAWRSWEHGPSKLFLNDLERSFDLEFIGQVRQLGSKALVATTNTWGANPISSLPALTSGDLIDVHAYSPYGALERNPVLGASFIHYLAAAQVLGMPMSVSEWNAEPFPLPDRHLLPLYVAATASHQAWDAVMHYAYTQEPVERNSASNWHGYNDPSLLAMMPAAALLYRERHVAEANTLYVLDPGAALFGQHISPLNSPALRTAMTRGRLAVAMPATRELPWLQRREPPAGATVLKDPAVSVLPADATQARSDTGELAHDWESGVYTIVTPRTRAAMGWLGGRSISLPGVELKFETPSVAVAVQSLDGRPVGESAELLVSVATRSVPQGRNRAPFLVEPVEGSMTIEGPKGLKAVSLGRGGDTTPWPLKVTPNGYLLELDGRRPVSWFLLRRGV